MIATGSSPMSLTVPRRGLTVLELLVTMGIISLLAGLLLPTVQQARESARQMQCKNHLKQIGIALHSYHDLYGSLPIGLRSDCRKQSAFAWAQAILPQLEQPALFASVSAASTITDPSLESVSDLTPVIYRCPSDPGPATFELYEEEVGHDALPTGTEERLGTLPTANYVGVFGTNNPDATPLRSGDGAFIGGRSIRFANITRGLSQVIVVGERTARKLPSTWLGTVYDGEDAPGRVLGNAWLGPNRDDADECEFDSRHLGKANFLWVDGHVSAVADSVDISIYRVSSKRD